MKLIVSKIGSVFRTRAAGSNLRGEQGETEGLIRHLVECGHDVLYFGKLADGVSLNGLCKVIEPHLLTLDGMPMMEETTSDDQRAGWARDAEAVREAGFERVPFVHVAGYAGSMSVVDNPKGARVQACGIRYMAPQLALCHELQCPRIVVNNDPRTYPRDQEMELVWPDIRPVALLDQQVAISSRDTWQLSEVRTVVGGATYLRRQRYAACESWGYLERMSNTGQYTCIVVAHAHIEDGIRSKRRDAAWHHVLDQSRRVYVYGKGWESYSGYDPEYFLGPIDGDCVIPLMSQSVCSPCVAPKAGFYTGKVYVLNAAGCIPLMYGHTGPTGDEFAWDPLARFVPENHPTRVKRPGDLDRAIDYAVQHRVELQRWFDEMLWPQWQVLDEMLDDFERQAPADHLWERYGGWRRL